MPSGKVSERTGTWVPVAACALYALLLALAAHAHTFWRDEAEAWIVARDSHGWLSLLHNVRYEGHPPGWYAVLYGITRFTTNVEWMKLPNFIFSVTAAAMILSAKRMALPVRLGFAFSYFFIFEYAVINRNYMMGIMLLIGALLSMKATESIFRVPAMLGLAALTSLPALVVSVCLYPLHLLPIAGDTAHTTVGDRWRAVGAKRLLAMMIFGLCVLGALAVIRPPADSGLLLDSEPRKSLATSLVHPFHDVAKAYLPLPVFRVAFWDNNLLGQFSPALFTLLGMALALGLCFFFRHKATRFFFLFASVLLLAQMAVSRRTEERHVGWLFVVFVLAILLDEVPWFRERDAGSATEISWRQGLLFLVLSMQVVGGLFAIAVSARYTFSGSKQVAGFLQQRNLAEKPMVFVPDYVGLPVLAYLRRPSAYYVESHGEGSIVVWNKAEFYGRHIPSRAEFMAASKDGSAPVLITEKPLTEEQELRFGVERLTVVTGEIYPEAYFVYGPTIYGPTQSK